jgi:DNA repair protein RecO (recombination protein O)
VHDALEAVLEQIADPALAGAVIVRFELTMLAELGFGLDLERCAATGTVADLVYVSPKTGRAVSRQAGCDWHDRLLALPAFLAGGRNGPVADELTAGFTLTGFFLARHVFEPRGLAMPDARSHLIAALLRPVLRP